MHSTNFTMTSTMHILVADDYVAKTSARQSKA
jgi:hypothetical protein